MFEIHLPVWLTKLFDWGSLSVTVVTLISWLPHIAAGLAVVWWILRIYGQWLENKKVKKEMQNADK
jgi:hypothetical protein